MRSFTFLVFFLFLPLIAQAKAVVVTWSDNSDNEDRFNLERKCDAEVNFAVIVSPGVNFTSITDLVVEKTTDIKCTYRVNAENITGKSGYSNEATITIPAIPLPPRAPVAPSNLKAN